MARSLRREAWPFARRQPRTEEPWHRGAHEAASAAEKGSAACSRGAAKSRQYVSVRRYGRQRHGAVMAAAVAVRRAAAYVAAAEKRDQPSHRAQGARRASA